MSYTPYTWQSGDTVTAARLNNIEQGVANAGGSGLIVDSIYDESELATVLDKSYAEITACLSKGVMPVFREEIDSGEYVYHQLWGIGFNVNYYVILAFIDFTDEGPVLMPPARFVSSTENGVLKSE